MRTWLLIAVAMTTATAGLIDPALREKTVRVDGREQISVTIALADQFDGARVIRTVKNKQERWETTVNGLQSLASSTQAGLLSELAAYEAKGAVSDVRPFWIVNAVCCKATPAVIQAVADRADVWFVEWNLIPTENALAIAGRATAPADGTDNPEWNVRVVKADSVWHVYGYTGENVIVGHIDTGCDYTHPDLAGHMWTDPNYPYHGWDFENNDNDPTDAQGHGTHTAGTVASNGTAGDTCGMAPKAQIMSCRTKTSISQPYPDTVAENTVMSSMQFCVAPPASPANHAHLLTMSLGWCHSWSPRRGLWRECMTNVAAAGLPYFIANGNEGGASPPDNVRTPGDCPGPWKHPAEPAGGRSGAISIGATDSADNLASFSSIGPAAWAGVDVFSDYPYPPGLYKPDFSAPGVDVTSCLLGGGYTRMSGTSMATPCAAGVCALMLEKNPNLLPEDVDQIMQNSVLPRGGQPKNDSFGTGRIDAMLCIANTPPAGPTHDIATDAVLVPADKIDPLTSLAPMVVVRNHGTYHETSITFYCEVESLGTPVYSQSTLLAGLDSAQTDTVTFPDWNVGPDSVTYTVTMYHDCGPDQNRANDTLSRTTLSSSAVMKVAIEIASGSAGRTPPNACYRIDSLCAAQGWEDSIVIGTDIDEPSELADYSVVVTGDVGYNDNDFTTYQVALKDWVRNGGGFVGLGWAVYGVYRAQAWQLDSIMAVSCSQDYDFLTSGLVHVIDNSHPVTQDVNDFNIQSHGEYANAGLQPGAVMLGDYAAASGQASIAVREVQAGRSVYLGPIDFGTFQDYSNESYYDDADAMRLLKQAIEWAAGGTSGITGPGPVPLAELRGAAPSPFRFRTTINYGLPAPGRARLAVYDLAGKLVKTLANGNLPAGPGQATWNRTDDAGKTVACGVYFCRLQTGGTNVSRKLVVR